MERGFIEKDLEIMISDTLKELKELKYKRKKIVQKELSLSEKVADKVTETIGSWKFIIIQSVLLFFWIILNITAFVQKWDPYPFIFLNLILSFQSAYAAPIIMMSQNRQADIDRAEAEEDSYVNLKAELEVELLHQKIDFLNNNLIEMKEVLTKRLIRIKKGKNKCDTRSHQSRKEWLDY